MTDDRQPAHDRLPADERRATNPAGMGTWIAVGIGIGVGIGVATDNLVLWMAIGAVIGLVIGIGMSRMGGS